MMIIINNAIFIIFITIWAKAGRRQCLTLSEKALSVADFFFFFLNQHLMISFLGPLTYATGVASICTNIGVEPHAST